MKKITLALVLFLIFFKSNAQTILSENFDIALNWSVVNLSANANAGWTQQTTGVSPTCAPFAGAGMARFNSYNINGTTSAYELNSPAMTFAGANYRIKFNMYKDAGYPSANDRVEVFFNTVAGSTGGTLLGTVSRYAAVNSWNSFTFLIPGTPSGSGYISLKATSEYGNNIFVDEVVIESVPACAEPTALTSSTVASTSATVNWTAPTVAPANGYEYYFSTSATLPTNASVASGAVSAGVVTKTITGLNSSTTYYVFVRSVCSGSSLSPWSNGISFTTACVPISSLPWSENYDSLSAVGSTNFPICWSKENGDWSTSNATTYNTPRSGANYLRNAWSATNEYMWTPGFNLTANVSYDFSYWTQGDGGTGWTVATYVSTAQSSSGAVATQLGATYTYPGTGTYSPGNYNQIKNSFTPTVAGTYYFALNVNQSSAAPWYVAFDDFAVNVTPSCVEPTAITANAITTNSATLSWTAAASAANGYEYYFSSSSTAPTAATVISGSVAPTITTVSLSGLLSGTVYFAWVRSKCSSTVSSSWSNNGTFSTLCSTATIPYIIDFEGVPVGSLPNCTNVVNEGTGNLWTVANAPGFGFTNKCLRYNYSFSNDANVWFYTNAMSLTGGTSYTITYKYGNNSATAYNEKLKVAYGTTQTSTAMTNLIADYPAVSGGSAISASVNITPAITGNYYIGFQAYSVANQDALYIDDIAVNVALSNNLFNLNDFKFYPNPVNDILTLQYSKDISSVTFYNLLRQAVLVKTINASQTQIDMSGFAQGTYILKVTVDGNSQNIKVYKN